VTGAGTGTVGSRDSGPTRKFDPREVEPAGLAQEAVAQLTAPYVLHARTHKLH
jgi:hypothetical protein